MSGTSICQNDANDVILLHLFHLRHVDSSTSALQLHGFRMFKKYSLVLSSLNHRYGLFYPQMWLKLVGRNMHRLWLWFQIGAILGWVRNRVLHSCLLDSNLYVAVLRTEKYTDTRRHRQAQTQTDRHTLTHTTQRYTQTHNTHTRTSHTLYRHTHKHSHIHTL